MKRTGLRSSFLISCLMCYFSSVYAQPFLESDTEKQGRLNKLEGVSITLYQFEKRLLDINTEIQQVVKEYNEEDITDQVAKQRLAGLLKEEAMIKNNIDYQVEKKLHETAVQSLSLRGPLAEDTMKTIIRKGPR